jgi:repressor LexA
MSKGNEIVEFVRDFTSKNGYSPTIREIGKAIGATSTSYVSSLVDKEIEAGRLTKAPNIPRSIRVVKNGR